MKIPIEDVAHHMVDQATKPYVERFLAQHPIMSFFVGLIVVGIICALLGARKQRSQQ
jgi:hypothetical protein